MQTLNLEAPTMRPYGQRVGKLTRFGGTWLDLDRIEGVVFGPEDGCGSEVSLSGGDRLHLSFEDAECLRVYLTAFESIQRDVDSIPVASGVESAP
jgi:hypothetical protein